MFILLLLLLTTFSLLPSMPARGLRGTASGPPGSCSFLASGASVPINRGLLCAVTSACLVYPAASLIFAASLPHGCSYLEALAVSIASAASWILSVQAFCCSVDLTDSGFCLMVSVPLGYCYIVAPIASWLLCPFGPLSCCFMASATCGPTFSHASWFLQLSPCFCYSVSDIPHPPCLCLAKF